MEGTPEEGMNEIRIIAPDSEGKLYLDHIIPASKVDARQQTADVQVPFVNKGTTNHWACYLRTFFMETGYSLDSGKRCAETGNEGDRETLQRYALYTRQVVG